MGMSLPDPLSGSTVSGMGKSSKKYFLIISNELIHKGTPAVKAQFAASGHGG